MGVVQVIKARVYRDKKKHWGRNKQPKLRGSAGDML